MKRVVRKQRVRTIAAGNVVKLDGKFRIIQSVVHTRDGGVNKSSSLGYHNRGRFMFVRFKKDELVERQRQK